MTLNSALDSLPLYALVLFQIGRNDGVIVSEQESLPKNNASRLFDIKSWFEEREVYILIVSHHSMLLNSHACSFCVAILNFRSACTFPVSGREIEIFALPQRKLIFSEMSELHKKRWRSCARKSSFNSYAIWKEEDSIFLRKTNRNCSREKRYVIHAFMPRSPWVAICEN